MRYFYYGNEQNSKGQRQADLRSNGMGQVQNSWQNEMEDGLIIEEDTIYEIDQECLACRKRRERK